MVKQLNLFIEHSSVNHKKVICSTPVPERLFLVLPAAFFSDGGDYFCERLRNQLEFFIISTSVVRIAGTPISLKTECGSRPDTPAVE
jgi:hypothetical protein